MAIAVSELCAGYGGPSILNSVTLEAEGGGFLGILGPNGSGKTTLLRAITGALPLCSGTVTLDGRPLQSLDSLSIAEQVAFVPQTETMLYDFTVREIVSMGRYVYEKKSNQAIGSQVVDDCLKQLDLEKLADQSIREVSGGEQRRALLARAFAQQTHWIIADEPASHLDLRYQHDSLGALHKLAGQGKGVIATLHDPNLALSYCSTVVLMNQGKVVSIGTPREVIGSEAFSEVFRVKLRWLDQDTVAPIINCIDDTCPCPRVRRTR